MSSAATDWANKRRAQILRAERLRAERKSGVVAEDEKHSNQSLRGRVAKMLQREVMLGMVVAAEEILWTT